MDAWMRRRGRHRVVASSEKSRETQPPAPGRLVSQGVRSTPPSPGPVTMDDLIRDASGRDGTIWQPIL
jgi:hypothetical protein